MDEATYQQLRAALQAQYTAPYPHQDVYDDLRTKLLQRQSAARTGDAHGGTATPPLAVAVKADEPSQPALPSQEEQAADFNERIDSFLSAGALKSMQGDRRESGVEHYLRQLNLPASAGLFRKNAPPSHCETFTQDADMSDSSDDDVSAALMRQGSEAASRGEDAASAAISSAAFVAGLTRDSLTLGAAPSPGDASKASASATPGGGADGAVDDSRPGDVGASAFLFASVPTVVKSSLAPVTCLRCRPRRDGLTTSQTGRNAWKAMAGGPGDDAPEAFAAIACGTSAGELWILYISQRGTLVGEPVLLHTHRAAVSDLSWTDDGRCLLCVSLDAFISVWDVDRREKVREIATQYPANAARFLPRNNNFCVVGSDTPGVRVFNLSTGILVRRVKTPEAVAAIATDEDGNYVFTADEKGGIFAFATVLEVGLVRRVANLQLGADRGLSHIAWQAGKKRADLGVNATGFGGSAFTDFLAANVHGAVLLINFVRPIGAELAGRRVAVPDRALHCLAVLRAIPVPQMVAPLKCSFCERQSAAASLCIAAGAEDGCVHIVTANTFRSDEVATLSPGYPCVIVDVSWDHSATVLAAGTDAGDVVCWRRLRISGGDAIDAAFQKAVTAGIVPSNDGSGEVAPSELDSASTASVGSAVSGLSGRSADSNPK
jgi:hypothetical protein